MTATWLPVAAAIPWLAIPAVVLWRGRHSRSLAEYPSTPAADSPTVTVVIPARNEAHNIARCMRSVLASAYPAIELIVVNDGSTDGTGDVARGVAREDRRARVVEARPLPDGWFGKQWSCSEGAAASTSSIICFTDADTAHAPDLMARAVNALRERNADLVTVAARQEMQTFWERVIQPLVFFMLLARYGGTEIVNRARRPIDKIANGQFMLFRRVAYDSLGGHASVRDTVAEDLALAQRVCAAGATGVLVLGLDQLTTRMYTSFRDIVSGWVKNVYAGGRLAMPGGRTGRYLYPVALLIPPLMMLAPLVILALAGLASPGVVVWAATSSAATIIWWALVYLIVLRMSPAYALAFPLGAAVFLYIVVAAIARGSRVRWKDRDYLSR